MSGNENCWYPNFFFSKASFAAEQILFQDCGKQVTGDDLLEFVGAGALVAKGAGSPKAACAAHVS